MLNRNDLGYIKGAQVRHEREMIALAMQEVGRKNLHDAEMNPSIHLMFVR